MSNDIDELMEKITEELTQHFATIQETTTKKLTLGQNIQVQQVVSILNIAVDIRYEHSWKKHPRYLNFDSSMTFKDNTDLITELEKNDRDGFRNRIDRIIKDIKETDIRNLLKNKNQNDTLEDFLNV